MSVRSLAELEEDWSVDDIEEAHEMLDAIEHAEADARQRAAQKRER